MALDAPWQIIAVVGINFALFYISSAIMCGIMFRRDSRRWTWLNIILSAVISTAWVFGWVYIDGLGSALKILFGVIIFFLCWVIWITFGGVGDKSAGFTTLGTLLLWFLLSWVFLIIMGLVGVTHFTSTEFPTLFTWFL
ncbi:MAG: hypothetical protein KAJ72_00120 [Candidatus Heimdallarchaeota archaeon]|nr:hypothetical protein [Candidatus Heimdallarchaeota archaeon]MCK5409110.1 hypothetical protein [Candidatus Heimdallarchaeota archaeon]